MDKYHLGVTLNLYSAETFLPVIVNLISSLYKHFTLNPFSQWLNGIWLFIAIFSFEFDILNLTSE